MSFTVTATQGGSPDIGMTLVVKVLTGQAASPVGASVSLTSATPSSSITPAGTGSWVYGANLGLLGTYTANGSTVYQQDSHGAGLECIALRSAGLTSAGTPVTIGGTATASSISIALLEILAGSGLAEDSSSPAPGGFVSATTLASAAFTPPAGSLLVAVVETNGGGGVTTMAVTDTSGLGLTWTERVKANGAGNGYAGVWTAQVPSAVSPSGLLMAAIV